MMLRSIIKRINVKELMVRKPYESILDWYMRKIDSYWILLWLATAKLVVRTLLMRAM